MMRKCTTRCCVLFIALFCTLGASGDERSCDADHKELLASIARDREANQAVIEQEIAATNDQVEQAHLRGQIEQGWDKEERLRAIAAHILRDCVRAARGQQ